VSGPSGRLARYALAAVLVRMADEGARVVMALLGLQRVGDVAVGGLLVAVLLVPHVVAAPLVGVLADRSRRPAILVAIAAVGFGGSLALASVLLGRIQIVAVVVVLLLGGCCGPALTGALTSQLPQLLAPARLPRAFGIDALTYNTAGIAGPAVAAILAGTMSATTATLALAASAAAGALVIATLPTRHSTKAAAPFQAAAMTSGVRAFVRAPVLGTVTAATTLSQFAAGASPILVTVAAARAGSPEEAGWVLAAAACGGLLGSLAWTWHPARPEISPTVVMVSLTASGVPVLLAACHPSPSVLIALFTVSGIANGPLFGALLVTRHQQAPEAQRSQVFTLGAGAKITAAAGGAALASTITAMPTGGQLAIAGTIPIVAGIGGAIALHRLSHHTPAILLAHT
jgi:MFS family permease